MAIPRWRPATKVTQKEEFLLKRLTRTKKLFGFLREVRHELFDDEFQAELETMYRDTGAGRDPVPPALMAMAVLLQAYSGASDAEAVELTVVDLRWQLVLDRLGADEPAFSQGTLHDFRARLIRTSMDRRLLERTVELARAQGGFDPEEATEGSASGDGLDAAGGGGAGRGYDEPAGPRCAKGRGVRRGPGRQAVSPDLRLSRHPCAPRDERQEGTGLRVERS